MLSFLLPALGKALNLTPVARADAPRQVVVRATPSLDYRFASNSMYLALGLY